MAFRDHIAACNRYDLARFRPLMIGSDRVGWLGHDAARHLAAFADVFTVGVDNVVLNPALATPAERTAAVHEVLEQLVADQHLRKLRDEPFPVVTAFGQPELMRLDRGAVPLFGIRAFGIHLNGYVRTERGLMMWIGRRSATKHVAPGKLDNIVAGGQPAGLSLIENVVKECAEEADMPRALALKSVPVGAITYCMEGDGGLKPDCMFCYDIELPQEFVPRNTDGEIDEFHLLPIDDVIESVRSGDAYKFNVNLVIIDFAIRHGLIGPDSESDYLDLLFALRGPARPLPGHPLVDGLDA